MAIFIASGVATESADSTNFSWLDNSNYSAEAKGTFSNRQLWCYETDGSLLPFTNEPSFTFAAYPSDTITIALPQDISLNIVMTLTSTNPQTGSIYTTSGVYTFLGNINAFIYGLIQQLTAQPNIANDTNFMQGLSALQTERDNAIQATTFSDQQSAQAAINRAMAIINNQQFIF